MAQEGVLPMQANLNGEASAPASITIDRGSEFILARISQGGDR
jgi:hypothetical protein